MSIIDTPVAVLILLEMGWQLYLARPYFVVERGIEDWCDKVTERACHVVSGPRVPIRQPGKSSSLQCWSLIFVFIPSPSLLLPCSRLREALPRNLNPFRPTANATQSVA